MTRGVTVSGYSNPNNIEIMMHCKKFFSGSISFLLLKQRLHRKSCNICKNKPVIYNKNNISEYYSSSQLIDKKSFSEDLDRQTKDYFIKKEQFLSE